MIPKPDGPWGGTDLHFLSPQPDTSLHCETTDAGLVYRAVCQFTPQLSLVLTAPTHWGMARLSWPGWLVTHQRHLSTSSDDTWRLICSPPPLPLTNKPYRPRLRFESCLTYGVLQVLFNYLLTYFTYRDGFNRLQMVTHPSTNQAQRRVTSLIETNVLPLSQTATDITSWSLYITVQ